MEKKTYIINKYDNGKPSYENDFYGWVNYDWIKNNRIPDDEVKYTHFIETQLKINVQLKEIIESNNFPLATQLYNSYIDMSYRNNYCLQQLKELLVLIDNVNNVEELIVASGKLAYIGVSTLFNVSIDSNIYNSNENIFYIGQPILGLPDREYYHNEKHQQIKQKYYETICLIYKEIYPQLTTLQLNNIASLLIDIESKLSIIFLSNADRRDADSTYHLMSWNELQEKYPKLYLKTFIKTLCSLSSNIITKNNFKSLLMEHHKDNSINYFKQLEFLLESYTLPELKEYFKLHTILAFMNLTNDKMRELHFDMFKKTLRGQTKQRPLWRSAISFTCSIFNDPISRIYKQKFFSQEA